MTQVNHRHVLENDAVCALSSLAELFFHRLTNVVDRYGCFDARPGMLRARLYPLNLDAVTNDNMGTFLAECVQAGLIKLYTVNGLPYLQIAGFKRRLGAYKSPYPEPPFAYEAQQQTTVEETAPATNPATVEEVAHPVTAEEAKPEPGREHEFFHHELFKRENEKYLSALAVKIRQPEIKHSWVTAFNEHIQSEGRRYTVDHEWLERLRVWLPLNVQRLIQEEERSKTRIKQRPRVMVL